MKTQNPRNLRLSILWIDFMTDWMTKKIVLLTDYMTGGENEAQNEKEWFRCHFLFLIFSQPLNPLSTHTFTQTQSHTQSHTHRLSYSHSHTQFHISHPFSLSYFISTPQSPKYTHTNTRTWYLPIFSPDLVDWPWSQEFLYLPADGDITPHQFAKQRRRGEKRREGVRDVKLCVWLCLWLWVW